MVTRSTSRAVLFLPMTLLLAAHTASTQTQVTTLTPVKDNTLYEDPAGTLSNGAGQAFFAGRSNQAANSIRRGLVAFDIAGALPSNAVVMEVTLTLEMSQTSSGDQIVSLHRVLADWGEGTSAGTGNEGGGAPSTPNDATWIHRFFDTATWSAPGGVFSATASDTLTVGALGTYVWGTTAAMVSDVQQWLTSPATNFGWLLRGSETAAGTAKRFNSRQNTDTTTWPQLTITYMTPNSVPENTPLHFALHQNYPNPFNPATTIRFDLAQAGRASLKIFNLLGQEVATLVDRNLSAGQHTVHWNAADFSTSVYIYRLEAAGNIATRKLVLAR